MLEAQSNGRLGSWYTLDVLPHVYKQHFPASKSDSTILLQRHSTCQDDVQRDVRTLLCQEFQLPYSNFQCPIVVSNNYSPFYTTFQKRNCVSSVKLNQGQLISPRSGELITHTIRTVLTLNTCTFIYHIYIIATCFTLFKQKKQYMKTVIIIPYIFYIWYIRSKKWYITAWYITVMVH